MIRNVFRKPFRPIVQRNVDHHHEMRFPIWHLPIFGAIVVLFYHICHVSMRRGHSFKRRAIHSYHVPKKETKKYSRESTQTWQTFLTRDMHEFCCFRISQGTIIKKSLLSLWISYRVWWDLEQKFRGKRERINSIVKSVQWLTFQFIFDFFLDGIDPPSSISGPFFLRIQETQFVEWLKWSKRDFAFFF